MNLDNKAKKQLAITTAATLVACVSSWMFFTSPANARAATLEKQLETAQSKFNDTQRTVRNLPSLESELDALEERLKKTASQLINGDQYLWVLQNLTKYQVPDALDFTGFDQPLETDWGLPGADRLKATSFLVKGVGLYQELGKFTAALENDYPGLRFRAITIWPNEPGTSGKVAFVLDIVGLLSPDQSVLKENLLTQK